MVGTITSISHSAERLPWYKAVPKNSGEEQTIANAKVVEDGMGKYRCPKNGKVYNGYTARYILRFSISDSFGQMWLTAFNEHAETILGKSAEELEKMIEDGNTDAFDEVFSSATFKKYVFRIRAREDSWEDQVRIRYGVQSVKEVDYNTLAKDMKENLEILESVMPACLMSAMAGIGLSGNGNGGGVNSGNGGGGGLHSGNGNGGGLHSGNGVGSGFQQQNYANF